MEGAVAHKRLADTATPTASGRLSKVQLARLMGWCGLGPGEEDKLPLIWGKLQAARDKEDARAVLVKHFERLSAGLEEPLNIYFLDRLVEDLIKLRLSPGREPDYDSAHLGVSILAVIPVSARAQVAMDEEHKDNARATVLTVSDVRAAKKGPPAPPRTYNPGMRILRQYKYFLSELFGMKCGHLNELALIYLSLRSLQFCLGESMGQTEWAHLFWAIIVDAHQFFESLTDAEDLAAGELPMSDLATTRSII